MRNASHQAAALAMLAIVMAALSAVVAAEQPVLSDVPYATIDGQVLRLDLYHPGEQKQTSPLIIWVHGGGWRSGSKSDVPIRALLDHGFAIASVDYRLTPVAPFPAQVHDINAAIRFMRLHAAEYKIDPTRCYVAGASAGGHLAALVGVSTGVKELEGHLNVAPEQSSAVAGIVSFYGAANLHTILDQSTPHGLSVRIPALQLLLGGLPDQQPDAASLASPVTHVDASDPPLLLIHGDQDPQMPVEQAYELHQAYLRVQAPVELKIVSGGVHGGKGFYEREMLAAVAEFLKSH
jgi:acetyl esterase/lipase